MLARLGRISIAIAVFCIWQEGDQNIFQSKCGAESVMLMNVENYARGRA